MKLELWEIFLGIIPIGIGAIMQIAMYERRLARLEGKIEILNELLQ